MASSLHYKLTLLVSWFRDALLTCAFSLFWWRSRGPLFSKPCETSFLKYDMLIKSQWSHDGLSAHPEECSCSGAFLTGNGVLWGVSWLVNAKNTPWHPSCPQSCSSWDESEQSQIVVSSLSCSAQSSPL